MLPEAFKRDIAALEESQADRLKALVTRRDSLIPRLEELREELRLWCSAELYMRKLMDLPEPERLPNFSVPSAPEDSIQTKLQRISDLANERKQKVPATKHRRDDRGR